jgi:hypothetical protein
MDVCPRFFCVVLSCVGRGLVSADPLTKESYQLSKQIQKLNFWTGTDRWPKLWRKMMMMMMMKIIMMTTLESYFYF